MKKNKELISLILFNLHEVCANLFGHHFDNYSINLFLRTDLYNGIREQITEKDKITKVVIGWKPNYLMQMINSRLKQNEIEHVADLLNDDLNMSILNKKIDKFVYDRPRDYVFIFNSLIQIAQAQKKDRINNKIFNEALNYYALYVGESIEAEFLSLHSNINYGEFVTNLKNVIGDKSKVQIKKFILLLTSMEVDDCDIKPFISFLLQIKMIFVCEESRPVEWNRLSNPEVKLNHIMKTYQNRYFYLHPIIEKLMEDYF